MATFVVDDENFDQTPDRSYAVGLAIDLLELQRNYYAIEGLGSGTYGDVLKMFDPESQTSFAAKIVTQEMITEAESVLWPTLDHPNIVPLTESVELSLVKAVVYIMPIQVASLRAVMNDWEFRTKTDALDQVKKWLSQTLSGLEYLHGRDLVHLDVKEDNVLISHSGTAMLCDFTCLNDATKPIHSTKVGSPFMYRPPEALHFDETVDGKPCDMWSFGIMSVEILADFFLAHNLPPSQRNWHVDVYPTLYEILQEHCFTMFFHMTFMKDQMNEATQDARLALDFVHGCLKMDPSKRVTSFQSKQHPFLIGGSDVVNAPDDIWENELSMGATEFGATYITSFNGGERCHFTEDVQNMDSYCFNDFWEDLNIMEKDVKQFETHFLSSRHSPVVTQMWENSDYEMRSWSSGQFLMTVASFETVNFSGVTKPQNMEYVTSLSEPQVLKTASHNQGNPSRFSSEEYVIDRKYGLKEPILDTETSQTSSKFLIHSETTLALESTNKCAEENYIPVSEKILNLRLRIKELIENSREIKQENAQKEEDNIPISKKIRNLRLVIKELLEKSARKMKEEIADQVYCQKEEDIRRENKLTQELDIYLDINSKGYAEDFMSGSKPISVAAILDSPMSIISPSKHHEDYEKTNFESFDVSSEDSLKIDLVKKSSTEKILSVYSTSLQIRGCKKRFIGWIQSKCLSGLMFCCPCTTTKNSSRKV
ncbi:hypothetical protein JTE90_013513 [Oedothorax gibbosus]|uniref:Protein kinase domain-containing protein n=1 Tax=Oedothorax gibbosus TaxID=931172 RepID=A0AAV6VMK1_9ARAC|nr:hypothetical protein JTE90_013513 [Oedothorax gibbosus]